MEISIASQTVIFFLSAVLGIFIGAVYDFFKIIRISTRASLGAVAVCDAAFCVICALALFLFVINYGDGSARAYIFVGTGLGGGLYFVTISRAVVTIGTCMAEIVKYVCKKVLKMCSMFISGIKKYIVLKRKG